MALVYYYYDPDGKTYDRQRSTLIAMTLAVVLISTLFFGAVTKPLLDLLLGPQGTGMSVSHSMDAQSQLLTRLYNKGSKLSFMATLAYDSSGHIELQRTIEKSGNMHAHQATLL